MDFYQIKERSTKNGVIEIYPDFKVGRSKDLMVRGRSFYAIWDDDRNIWSTDEYDVQRLVDADLMKHKEKTAAKTDGNVVVKLMSDFSSKSWVEFRNYMSHVSDSSHQLDEQLTFFEYGGEKNDYVSKRLLYPLEKGLCNAYDEIIGTLYDPDERAKLEWAIGAVVSGDAKVYPKVYCVIRRRPELVSRPSLTSFRNYLKGIILPLRQKRLHHQVMHSLQKSSNLIRSLQGST